MEGAWCKGKQLYPEQEFNHFAFIGQLSVCFFTIAPARGWCSPTKLQLIQIKAITCVYNKIIVQRADASVS